MTEANEQHEPSYYEIALTNRQVMAAFVILLLCVLGAFFSGVWVGRGGKPDRRATATTAQQPATPSAQPMQELEFFSGKPLAPPAPAASSTPGTSLAADLGTDPKKVVEPASGSTGAEPDIAPAEVVATAPDVVPPAMAPSPAPQPSAVQPAPVGATADVQAGRSSAAPKPAVPSPNAPAASTATVAPSAKPVTRSPEPASGEMVVQVFSTPDGEQAKKTVQRINKGGFKAYISPLQVGAQTMYRVRIGPFTDRASAQEVADQVRKRFKLDTWITR